ncbi:MAG: hypothetical protein MI861_21250 [Pirellulales bacterium]|nr:hypothetical protein [Pirellulales bacterium]
MGTYFSESVRVPVIDIGVEPMKVSSIIALLFIGAVIYYVTGGGGLFGLGNHDSLPETKQVPDATFLGDEQQNPFVNQGLELTPPAQMSSTTP